MAKFWVWYEKHRRLNTGLAAFLFVWQLVHLYWLSTAVVTVRLIGMDFFPANNFWQFFLVLVDYTEIPALLGTSLVYVNELRKGRKLKPIVYLLFLNSQWLYLFWITDEVVVRQFLRGSAVLLPLWLSWLAIAIDYLELPVIYDTFKKFFVRSSTT